MLNIPGYSVEAQVAAGATSVVYRVARAGLTYALKLSKTKSADSPELALRMRREACALAQLEHKNLARVFDVGEHNGHPYLVTDLVEGKTLEALLAQGTLPEQRVIDIGIALSSSLSEVHRHGLVHRDIKPSNVIVGADGVPHVIDFGLVALATDLRRGRKETVGTFAYAPPEQNGRLNRPIDARSDLYSLGVLLFECATGRRPFVADDVGELIELHARQRPPAVRALNPGVSRALDAIIATLLAKDPDDRYQTATGLRHDLLDIASDAALHNLDPVPPLRTKDALTSSAWRLPFVGRRAPLEALTTVWSSASKGQGGAALVEGEPGSGKTRLVAELREQAVDEGGLILSGKAQENETEPFAVFREALDDYVSRVLRMSSLAEGAAESERLRAVLASLPPGLARISPGLAMFSPERKAAARGPDVDLTDLVVDFMLQLARERGRMLVVLDDVQWLDEASTKALVSLATRASSEPVCVVAIARNDPRSVAATDALQARLGTALSARLQLQAFTATEARELIQHQLGGRPVDDELIHELLKKAQGNPLALIEYVRALLDTGALRPAAGRWEVDRSRASIAQLPGDVVSLLVARVTRLAPETVRVLQAAVVQGMSFSRALVIQVTGLPADQVIGALVEASSAALIETVDDDTLRIVHDRVREALYETLPSEERKDKHQRYAELIIERGVDADPELFAAAQHLAEGFPERMGRRAYNVFMRAAERGLASTAARQAEEHGRRALALAEAVGLSTRDRVELYSVLGRINVAIAEEERAIEWLKQAVEAADDPLVRGRLYVELAHARNMAFDSDGALEYTSKGLATLGRPLSRAANKRTVAAVRAIGAYLARRRLGFGYGSAQGDDVERGYITADLFSQRVMAHYFDMTMPELVKVLVLGLRAAFDLGPSRPYVESLCSLGAILGSRRGPAAGLPEIERARAIAKDLGDRFALAHVERYRGMTYHWGGALDAAMAQLDKTIREHGSWFYQRDYVSVVHEYAIAAFSAGRAHEALAVQEQLIRRADATGAISTRHSVRAIRVGMLAAVGRITEAAAVSKEVAKLVPQLKHDRWQAATRNTFLARLYLAQDEVGPPLDQMLLDWAGIGVSPALTSAYHRTFYFTTALLFARRYALAPGDGGAARAQAHERIAICKKIQRWSHEKGLCAAAEATVLARDNDVEAARRAVARGQALGSAAGLWARFELALAGARVEARADSGELLGAVPRKDAAAGFAREAHRIAVEMRNPALQKAVAQEFDVDERLLAAEAGSGAKATSGTGSGSTSHSSGSTSATSIAELTTSARVSEALMQVSLQASGSLDPQEQAATVLLQLVKILAAERALLFLVDDKPQDAQRPPRFFAGRDDSGGALPEPKDYSKVAIERALSRREAVVLSGTEDAVLLGSESAVAHNLRSIICAPLVLQERLIGVVYLDSRLAKGVFRAEDAKVLVALASHVAFAVEMARAAKVELERAALQRDVELTAAVQRLFFPAKDTHTSGTIRLEGRLWPAERCSGDWWWFEDRPDGEVRLLLGDVTGHGPAPALVTASVATAYRTASRKNGTLSEALHAAHDEVRSVCRGEFMMTLAALSVSPHTATVSFHSAACPPALVVKTDGRVTTLGKKGSPLGAEAFNVGTDDYELQDGERIFLCSDGVLEMELKNGRPFGLRRAAKMLEGTARLPFPQALAHVEKELRALTLDVKQDDDITFVLIERAAGVPRA